MVAGSCKPYQSDGVFVIGWMSVSTALPQIHHHVDLFPLLQDLSYLFVQRGAHLSNLL